LLAVFALGTLLMRSAGCAVNDVADRDFDKHVKRTAQRPVTSGAISPKQALVFGAALALVAFALVLTTNAATIAWSFAALAVAIFYPFTKRFFSMPQAVLGVAFSFGIPMAFAAVRGEVPALAWWLLLGNLFWVLAYDTEYAMVDRDDDIKLGLRSSAILFGRCDVAGVMICHAVFILIMVYIGYRALLGAFYFVGLAIAVCLIAYQYVLIRSRQGERCFKAFLNNNWLGAAIFAGIVANFIWFIPLLPGSFGAVTR
jgi:4-hydroxybenzoate polyprenyltransferase